MKLGDKKKVRIPAKDAYGEEFIERTIPTEQFKEVDVRTVPQYALLGIVNQKIPKDQLQNVFSDIVVGAEKSIGETTMKIVALSDSEATVAINEPKAPFYGKELAEGMKATTID
jgi:hypothetical protein